MKRSFTTGHIGVLQLGRSQQFLFCNLYYFWRFLHFCTPRPGWTCTCKNVKCNRYRKCSVATVRSATSKVSINLVKPLIVFKAIPVPVMCFYIYYTRSELDSVASFPPFSFLLPHLPSCIHAHQFLNFPHVIVVL